MGLEAEAKGRSATGSDGSRAAIVLCGGRSRRMGRDKASLPFGADTLISRIIGILAAPVDEICVVAREGQELPAIPDYCIVARDAADGLGPLAGLAAGLERISSERAFLTSCDAPLLQPAYVELLFTLSLGHAVAVPQVGDHYMVTSAIYSREVLPIARRLLAEGRLRPRFLVEEADARVVEEAELRSADPELRSLINCNTPEDYREALRIAGLQSESYTDW